MGLLSKLNSPIVTHSQGIECHETNAMVSTGVIALQVFKLMMIEPKSYSVPLCSSFRNADGVIHVCKIVSTNPKNLVSFETYQSEQGARSQTFCEMGKGFQTGINFLGIKDKPIS